MGGLLVVGIVMVASLVANLGLMIWVWVHGSRKAVFIGFDPGDRSLVPRKLGNATKHYIWKHKDGRATFFPLPKGYGHTWGKKKAGVAYIGDLSTGQPITWQKMQKVVPAEDAAKAGSVLSVTATRQVDPGGDYMGEVLRDNREVKMLTASRQAQGGGFDVKMLLIIGAAVLAGMFILPKIMGGG